VLMFLLTQIFDLNLAVPESYLQVFSYSQ